MIPDSGPPFRFAMFSIRSASRRALALGAALTTFLACSSPPGAPAATPPPGAADGLRVETVVSGLSSPVYVTSPPGDSRLFVVEQPGRIRIIKGGALVTASFLDINDKVINGGGERGLLSVAFHPQYATNGLFYVNYIDNSNDTRIERYHVSDDPDVADHASAQLVIGVDQPSYSNHKGGHVLFGPDGMLYIGMGDGGSGGDPENRAQNLNSLLGKMLRIDVNGGDPYAIPGNNPFVGQKGKREEIWAYGLRNPWRFWFDRVAGLFFIGDVGQNQYEEINAVAATSAGVDYGWRVLEGAHCYSPAQNCDTSGRTMPVVEYTHDDGCSVTGGIVYRGTALPGLAGHYFYGDYCNGWIRSFRFNGSNVTDHREWKNVGVSGLSSFGEDAAGNMYACSLGGSVYRFVWQGSTQSRRR